MDTRYTNDPRRELLVHGATYRRQLEAARQKPEADGIADVISALAVFAFLTAAGLWLMVLA